MNESNEHRARRREQNRFLLILCLLAMCAVTQLTGCGGGDVEENDRETIAVPGIRESAKSAQIGK